MQTSNTIITSLLPPLPDWRYRGGQSVVSTPAGGTSEPCTIPARTMNSVAALHTASSITPARHLTTGRCQ
jgi:hypothetical protein